MVLQDVQAGPARLGTSGRGRKVVRVGPAALAVLRGPCSSRLRLRLCRRLPPAVVEEEATGVVFAVESESGRGHALTGGAKERGRRSAPREGNTCGNEEEPQVQVGMPWRGVLSRPRRC